MKIITSSLIVSLLILWPISAVAIDCRLGEGYSIDVAEHVKQRAELAEANLRQLTEFQEFIEARDWEEGKPMGSQMSAEEASSFGRYQKQQEIAVLKNLIESRRERDLLVTHEMATLADKISRYGLEDTAGDDKNSRKFLMVAILLGARNVAKLEIDDFLGREIDSCNFELALVKSAQDAASELDGLRGLQAANLAVNQLAEKYGVPVDFDTFSDADRLLFMESAKTLREAEAIIRRAKDLYMLSLIERVSKKMLTALKQDQYESPGDVKYLGTTWGRWVNIGKITQLENEFSGVINFINEKFPSKAVTEADESLKMLRSN